LKVKKEIQYILHILNNLGTPSTLTTIDTGWINTNDWTNRHLGSIYLNYDNLVGTFTVGETITEAISGYTGAVMTDSGAILVLKDVVGGFFTNNRQITGGTSGATADVNGATKNIDTDFYHGLTINMSQLISEFLISTDGTDNNSFFICGMELPAAGHSGFTRYQIDTDSYKWQTGGRGLVYLNDAGVAQLLDTEDWYYKIKCYYLS